MTPEEVQRKMEFIIEQQAQFTVHIDRLRDSHATLTASLLRLAELMEESQRENDERFRKTDEQIRALAEAQNRADERARNTDERLNALISLFERHITGPEHGRPQA
jgi:hypothetical protein